MSRTYRKSSWALEESEDHHVADSLFRRHSYRHCFRKSDEQYEAEIENALFDRQKKFEEAYQKAGEERSWGHMDEWEDRYKNGTFYHYVDRWCSMERKYYAPYVDKNNYVPMTDEEIEKEERARYRKQFRDGRNRQSGRNQMFKDLSKHLIRRENKKMIKKYFEYGEDAYDQPHYTDWHGKQFVWSVW